MTQANPRRQSSGPSPSSPELESGIDAGEQSPGSASSLGTAHEAHTFHPDGYTALQTQEEEDTYKDHMRTYYPRKLEKRHLEELGVENLETLKLRLSKASEASKPFHQFHSEVNAEMKRIGKEDVHQILRLVDFWKPDGYFFIIEKVKQFWIGQGIWDTNWPKSFTLSSGSEEARAARWKHEEPSSQAAYDSDLERPFGPYARGKRPLQKSRDASRPLYQFLHQVSRECKRIEDKIHRRPLTTDDVVLEWVVNGGSLGRLRESEIRRQWEERKKAQEQSESAVVRTTPDDISTMAYRRVKNIWIERELWREEWSILPGLTWAHEETVEPTQSKSTEPKSVSIDHDEESVATESSESPKPKKRAYKVTKTSKKKSTRLPSVEPSRRSTRLREAKQKA